MGEEEEEEEECAFHPLLPKDERVTDAKDGSFEATAASLSGRALNFPRLNRSSAVVVVCRGVSSLYFRLHARRQVAKTPVSSLTSYIRRSNRGIAHRDVERAKLLEELKFLLDELPRRPSTPEIYVSEIISFSFGEIKRFVPAYSLAASASSETKFDDVLLRCIGTP